jgi:transcriptional regulator NrdR family protein
MAETLSIGIDTLRTVPEKRASNSMKSLPMRRRCVACADTFSTISPLRTNSAGT